MPMVVATLLRMVTSSKTFVPPTPVADAMGFVDAILAMPGVQLASLGRNDRSCGKWVWTTNSAATSCPMLLAPGTC